MAKRIEKIVLPQLLKQQQMMYLKGGENNCTCYDNGGGIASWCTCSCYWEGSGGSSVEDNRNANIGSSSQHGCNQYYYCNGCGDTQTLPHTSAG